MGFKELRASAPVAMSPGLRDAICLYRDRVAKPDTRESHPLAGVTARVEQGSDLEKRVTAARLVAIGVFAFAAKKKSGGEVFLTVEGPDFFWSQEVERKNAAAARAFAAKVNDAARKAAASA